MAITTMDGVVAGLAVGRNYVFNAASFTSFSAGWTNSQRATITSFGQMAIPSVASSGGTLHVTADAGFPTIPAPVGVRYLARVDMVAGSAGTLHIYDRVWSCSGFSGTVNTAQAVTGFPTLTRPDVNGTGLELWIECYTATGASASNITVQYTNSDNVSGRNTVSVAHVLNMAANRMYPVPLQSGDVGVKSVQSVTLSSTTGTAGNFGVTLLKRIATIQMPQTNVTNVLDFAGLGLPQVQEDSAVNLIHQGTTSASGQIIGSLTFIDG